MVEPTPSRVDLAALTQRRALLMLPVIVFGLALPFLTRAAEPLWSDASVVAQARLFARLAVSFVLLGCYPAALLLVRVGLTDLTAGQHRALLRMYMMLATTWQVFVALDAFVLVASPGHVALPSVVLDIAVSVGSAAFIPLITHHQAYFFGFDPDVLRQSRGLFGSNAPELAHARAPVDTLDYRVLQLVANSGSDVANVMINDMGIGFRDLMLRLSKLVALGYLNVVEEMHGPQVVLTTLATDTLALPISLFTWETDDRELLAELAAARLALESRQPQKVVVACARSCERLLRGALSKVEPRLTHAGNKELSKATLGELVGACRQHKLIGKFEDGILSAINERRKKIHAIEGEAPIDDQDAFVIYTLTEIVARDRLTRTKHVSASEPAAPTPAKPAEDAA